MSHESIPFILYAISAMFIAALGVLHWGEQHGSERTERKGTRTRRHQAERVKK